MRYEDNKVGFSFELPPQWKKMEHAFPLTFACNNGCIQIQIGVPLASFVDPAKRKEFLQDSGCAVISGKTLGGEANTVMIENQDRGDGIISTVRDNMKYDITYGQAGNPAVREAIGQILASFQFPSAETSARTIQEAQAMGFGPQAVLKTLYQAGSPEEARDMLNAAGIPSVQGSGYTIHQLGVPAQDGQKNGGNSGSRKLPSKERRTKMEFKPTLASFFSSLLWVFSVIIVSSLLTYFFV